MAHILVIDDDKLFRTMMRRTLESAGYEVSEAENGEVGLRIFAAKAADLVITDILMPDKEGIETIRELRSRGHAVKILAVSGGGRTKMTEFLKIAERFGADASLRKPFRTQELLDQVAGLLGLSALPPGLTP